MKKKNKKDLGLPVKKVEKLPEHKWETDQYDCKM